MPQRILVIGDAREIVRSVRTCLEQNDYEVLVAYDGETALHILRCERPDLVLLDLALPERNGPDVTRVVRGDGGLAAMPVIVLTARVEDHDKEELYGNSKAVAQQLPIVGLELAADDCATKPFNLCEVVARVRAVLRHVQGEPAQPAVIQVGKVTIDLDACQVEVGDQAVHLTPTEFALLRTLAERPGHALTRLEMIEGGLGYSYEGLERTVDSHVKNLRRKLDKAGGAEPLIETVFGVGYRLATGYGLAARENNA